TASCANARYASTASWSRTASEYSRPDSKAFCRSASATLRGSGLLPTRFPKTDQHPKPGCAGPVQRPHVEGERNCLPSLHNIAKVRASSMLIHGQTSPPTDKKVCVKVLTTVLFGIQ